MDESKMPVVEPKEQLTFVLERLSEWVFKNRRYDEEAL
jgi:hypothetical protein